MHLADPFIQSDLHCIQVTVLHFLSSLSEKTSIFSPEFTLCLHPTSSAGTPHSRERQYESKQKLEITVYKVLNMDIFLTQMHRLASEGIH